MCGICVVCARRMKRAHERERERVDQMYVLLGDALNILRDLEQEVGALKPRVDRLQNRVTIVAPSRS